jgi:hypothetical protein
MNCIKKYLILIFVLSIILLIYFYVPVNYPRYMLNSNYAPDSDGFSGVKISDLIQSPQFYSQKRESTIRYLLSVYPVGKESFEKLNDLQLGSFYNSLNYYHNCSFEYNDSDLSNNWDSLSCKDNTPLPYPPQGWFFNFYTYQKYNIPRIFSDSNENREELKLQNFGSGRPGYSFSLKNKEKTGPGLFFYNPRTIQRDIWFPNGLSITKIGNEDIWQYVVNKKITWNYPKNWYGGFSDYSYTEVTHSQPIPGMVQSLGWWWNCVTGSGIFLNVGKSLRVKNKLDAVYTLLKKMKKDFLQKFFQTDDIYDIIHTIIVKCLCNSTYTPCQEYCEPDYEGVLKESGLPIKNFETEIKRFQKQNNIKDYREAFIKSVNAAINNFDYRLNRISSKVLLDETIFFLGINAGYDTIQLPLDPNINGYYTFEIIDLRIPKEYLNKAKMRDYSDFINIQPNPNDNEYNQEFIQQFINKFIEEEIISVRDPLDIKNNKKVQKCKILDILQKICPYNVQFNQAWYNFYCENVPISKEYKCLGMGKDADPKNECVYKGENISC